MKYFDRTQKRQKSTDTGSSLIELSILLGAIAVIAIPLTASLGAKIDTMFSLTTDTIASIDENYQIVAEVDYISCQEIYQSGQTRSGVYKIARGKENKTRNVYCQMLGPDQGAMEGGWTLASWQMEKDPAIWGSGISLTRKASTFLDTSFSMSQNQTPSHTHTAFGSGTSGGSMEMMDGIKYSYYTMLMRLKEDPYRISFGSGNSLLYPSETINIKMGSGRFYADCQYNGDWGSFDETDASIRSLSFEPVYAHAGSQVSWMYNVNDSNPDARGYCYNTNLSGSSEQQAWALWVR